MKPEVFPKKALGFYTLTSIGVSSIIGAGIFAFPASIASLTGPILLLAILISGFFCLLFALSCAELGAAFPLTGGLYAYTKMSMGPLASFIIGWGSFIFLALGDAVILDIFIMDLGYYFKELCLQATLTPLGVTFALMMLWFVTFLNILGVRWGGIYSLIMSGLKILFLLLFCVAGLFFFEKGNFTPFVPFGMSSLTVGISLFFWAYLGFETICIPADEIIHPSKTIPKAMIFSLLISIVLYLFVGFVFVGMNKWQNVFFIHNLSDFVAYPPFIHFKNMKTLTSFAMIGAIIATAGAVGSCLLAKGRLPYAMAKDHLFLSHLSKLHPRFRTPSASLIFSSLVTSIVLIGIPNFAAVSLISSICIILPYAAGMLSLTILRKTHGEEKRPFRLPFAYGISLFGFVIASYLIYWATWPWTLLVSICSLLGYGVFYLFHFKETHFHRSAWIICYLGGITLFSYFGKAQAPFTNFTHILPKGWLIFPYDLLYLGIFSIVIYFWAYYVNIRYKPEAKLLGEKIQTLSQEKGRTS